MSLSSKKAAVISAASASGSASLDKNDKIRYNSIHWFTIAPYPGARTVDFCTVDRGGNTMKSVDLNTKLRSIATALERIIRSDYPAAARYNQLVADRHKEKVTRASDYYDELMQFNRVALRRPRCRQEHLWTHLARKWLRRSRGGRIYPRSYCLEISTRRLSGVCLAHANQCSLVGITNPLCR